MAADSGIDPRYAAQFQRGFDPALHPVVERRGPTRIEVPRAVVQPVPDPPPVVERPRADLRAVEADAPEAVESDELPAPRPRTEWALLAVGILFPVLAGGIWWATATDPRFYNGYPMSPTEQFIVLAQNYLPGPLLVAGVLAVLAWVVLRAVGRAR